MKHPDWGPTVDRMLHELASSDARTETYWAQQLAFSPHVIHALGLRMRAEPATGGAALVKCAELALSGFGALPEPPAVDHVSVGVLAMRQARALGWRRRANLRRLLQRLGVAAPVESATVPLRMARNFPLIGFRPDDRLAG
jgi:hypothetical protein